MADTMCPTCGEPWDMAETTIIRAMRHSHRCPCCPKDMETDSKLLEKMEAMLFDGDCDDSDPMGWL